jgi:predicted  nucleic acid-binding Zn-ribbon protein
MVKALELELAAFVKRTIEYEAGKMIKVKTKDYLPIKDFKDAFGPFEEKFHEGAER